jgi:hypothetical protein
MAAARRREALAEKVDASLLRISVAKGPGT